MNRTLKFSEGSVSDMTAANWFKKFRQKNYELKDEPRSGRPAEIDID
jgi:transposase